MVAIREHFKREGPGRESEWARQRRWFIKAKHEHQRREDIADKVEDNATAVGMAVAVAATRIRYCNPTTDTNRARWPVHELWRQFESVIGNDLLQNCAGVLPSDVIHANRMAKMRELDAQLSGLFITRAAVSNVSADDFEEFMEGQHRQPCKF